MWTILSRASLQLGQLSSEVKLYDANGRTYMPMLGHDEAGMNIDQIKQLCMPSLAARALQ